VTESAARFDIQPSASNHFAWIRTQLGLQRTLMAAVRTSVSLIGFGFTVAQFFQRLQGSATDDVRHLGPEAPRNLGLVLIAAVVISLAIFTSQYHSATAYLRSGEFSAIASVSKKPLHTSSYLTASAVMLIGIAAFVSIFARF
jgi:putative membrane protein